MVQVELSNSFRVNGFITGDKDGCFAAVCVSDHQDCVIASRRQEFHDEIYGDSFKWSGILS
jgi:hypothetical protein